MATHYGEYASEESGLMSRYAIAEALGITYQSVAVIEARALAKVRKRAPWLADHLDRLGGQKAGG